MHRWWTGSAAAVVLACAPQTSGAATGDPEAPEPWWHRFPIYAGDVGGEFTAERAAGIGARMLSGNCAADPGWGPYGQRLSALQLARPLQVAKEAGLRWITWMEGFGEAVSFAVTLARRPDGSFETIDRDGEIPLPRRNAWSRDTPHTPATPGNEIRWVGVHNPVENEDFIRPLFTRERLGYPVPTYPDGRPATGRIEGVAPPLCYRCYDAVAARGIDGLISHRPFIAPSPSNTSTPAPGGSVEGLYAYRFDANTARAARRNPGDIAHLAAVAFEKDPAAPFWIEYARVMTRDILRRGIDGLWIDNFSPFNNFGVPPLRNAFGRWTEHRFREFIQERIPAGTLREMGVADPRSFDVRACLLARARELGARDPLLWSDPAWRDPRWLDDPVWNAFKAFKQHTGQQATRALHDVLKQEARAAGRTDFLVAGNDLPCFGLGWTRDAWLDMVSTETTNGWDLATGSRGIGLPPWGRHAPVYLAARAHQRGPYLTAWYHLRDPVPRPRKSDELARVLLAEAFACGAFLKYGDNPLHPGTGLCVTEWNLFLARSEPALAPRRPLAEVGVVFSPDTQLAAVVPGAPAINHDRQAHLFAHWGFGTALVEAHVPYRALADWQIVPESLHALRVLVLPQVECLDESAVSTLDTWVRAGGHLVLTGPAGMRQAAAGLFRKRSHSALAPLLGQPGPRTAIARGRGTVTHVPDDPDIQYYLREGERPGRRAALIDLLGPGDFLRIDGLPTSVGAFPWETHDRASLSIDLVNYDYDPESDRVRPALNLSFRLPARPGWTPASIEAISPDGLTKAWAEQGTGPIQVNVPKLRHFASIHLTWARN